MPCAISHVIEFSLTCLFSCSAIAPALRCCIEKVLEDDARGSFHLGRFEPLFEKGTLVQRAWCARLSEPEKQEKDTQKRCRTGLTRTVFHGILPFYSRADICASVPYQQVRRKPLVCEQSSRNVPVARSAGAHAG